MQPLRSRLPRKRAQPNQRPRRLTDKLRPEPRILRHTNMNYTMNIGAESEGNVEVHKYYSGTVLLTAFLALILQAFLHGYGRWAELIDLPLLVTVYFGVSRRNPV